MLAPLLATALLAGPLLAPPLLMAPPAAPTHWATRDWRIHCGAPGGDTLAAYADDLNDPDARGRKRDRQPPSGGAGCVADPARIPAVLAELGRLVDHFDPWAIRPQLVVFGGAGDRHHRLYVHNLRGSIAHTDYPPASAVPVRAAATRVNADPVRAFGAGVDPAETAYILAHELTHVMQRASAVWGASTPASVDGNIKYWVSEGMADAVGFDWIERRRGTAAPSPAIRAIGKSYFGSRPYWQPLPISDPRYRMVARRITSSEPGMYGYRTSSFWRYLMDRRGGGDPRFFAELLRHPPVAWPGGGDTDWIAWLDGALRAAGGAGLSDAFGAFLPEYLSWGFTRLAGWPLTDSDSRAGDSARDTWLRRGFGGCRAVPVEPGAPTTVALDVMAMAGACLRVDVRAPGFAAAGLDVIATTAEGMVLDGLHLGLGRVESPDGWDCYPATEGKRLGGRADCRLVGRRIAAAAPAPAMRTWTISPHRLGEGHGVTFWLTLASFPDSRDLRWLDRQDRITLRVGVRAATVSVNAPGGSAATVPDAGPVTGALTGVTSRGARPGLPTAGAASTFAASSVFGALTGAPALLGTTGLPAGALAEGPAGLPGLALYGYAADDPVPAQIATLVFGAPPPPGFAGRAGAALVVNLDPSRAPPRLAAPAARASIPVQVRFDRDELALRFDAPLCIADLDAVARDPSPATLTRALCAERAAITAAVSLPFGEYYVMGRAAPLDPDAVRLPERDPAADAPAKRDAHDPPTADPAAGDGGAGAALDCACTCARLARHHAELRAVTAAAEQAIAALEPDDLAALAAEGRDPMPVELTARMASLDAFGACIDRCAEVFDRCD